MKGDLEDTFEKNGKMLTRKLNPDKTYRLLMVIIHYQAAL